MTKEEIIEGNKAVIYKIVCSVNQKYYVGSTVNFSKRKSQHIKELKLNKHHCKPLQAAFNKYGADSFSFNIIEIFTYSSRKDVLLKEQEYLNLPDKKYNTFLVAGSPLGVTYGNYSEERKKNMSVGMKGKSKTDEHKLMLSQAKLKGTANDMAIVGISEDGVRTEYRSISEAVRLNKIGVQTIYDSLNNIKRKWKRKQTLKTTWLWKATA